MNNKPVGLSTHLRTFMYFKIAKTAAQEFRISQSFRTPILSGVWQVTKVADKRITVRWLGA